MKHKILPLFLLISFSLLLTSCIDVLHYISLHDGELDLRVRYTFPKPMMEMAEMVSEGSFDYRQALGLSADLFSGLTETTAGVTAIDTVNEFGAEIVISGQVETLRKELEGDEFLPVRDGGGYRILLPAVEEAAGDGDPAADAFMDAFIEAAKYRILVDLSGDLADLSGAEVRVGPSYLDPSEYAVNVYGSSMLIELSVGYIYGQTEELWVELY